jgi:Tfp pilus assembly protein PilF
MISFIGRLTESFGTMSWGIMFLGLNLNVRVKLIAFFYLISGSLAWAGVPYSISELRETETSDEAKIRELRDQEINQLRIALGRRLPAHRKADLYFRLAEIHMEAYRIEFLLEGRVHENRLENKVEDHTIDRAHSRPHLISGIKACKEILGFKIPYQKADQVYYFLGFYFGELENFKESTYYYSQLATLFPSSPFTGQAYLELANQAFKSAHYQDAKKYFELATTRVAPDLKAPILHKLAWSYYRIKQYDRAIATMKQAISECSRDTRRYGPLRVEALRDMATLMTERGQVAEAIQYFEEVAGDKSLFPEILEKLGRQYERNVEIEKAITVYETLLKTHPNSEASFRVLAKLIELDIKAHHFQKALSRLKNYTSPEGGNTETQVAAQNLKILVRKVATSHHQEYRKKKDRAHLEIAEGFYFAYLEFFLKSDERQKETPEIRMYLAEVKKELGKSREVAELYRLVVASKDKRYSKEAAVLWTASLAEAIKQTSHKSEEPTPLENEFVEAADFLQESLGDVPESREAALRAAQVLAGYKSTRSKAIKRIQTIISNWPRSQQALVAAQLWIQLCLDRKPQSEGMEELAQVIQQLQEKSELLEADRTLNHGKLRASLSEQENRIKIGAISKNEKNAAHSAAAKGYEDFAATASQKDLAENAYAGAINAYLKEDDETESILRVVAAWSKRYPQSPKAVVSLRTIATNAFIRGKFDLSSRIFEKLGTEYQDPESLETAARFYEALGITDRAQQTWALYLERYKNSPGRWRVALALARSQEASRMDGEASRSYRICSGGPPEFEAECQTRLADLYLKNRDFSQAKSIYKKVGSQGSRGKANLSSPFIGYARYKLAELAENEARFEPLKLPEAQLQKGLNQRLNFLEPLSQAYQSAVQVGGPWSIAALNRLALWAMKFADDVDAIEPPASAQGSSLEKFKKDLGSVSQPLREKAKMTWIQGYNKAVSVNIFSPALPEIADHLADFNVLTPGRAQGPRSNFHLAGLSSEGGKDGKTSAFEKVRSNLTKNVQDGAGWVDYGNLLWGDGKPFMAKLAYERALSLNSKNTGALNNSAVVKLMSEGEEDWIVAAEGSHLFEEALRIDDFFLPSKMNLATLMNYYRLFPKAKSLWDQVLVRNPNHMDAQDGFAIALQGAGNPVAAEGAFRKATELGAKKGRFSAAYHEGARYSTKGSSGAARCMDELSSLGSDRSGFEKVAIEYLKGKCLEWRNKN